MLRNMFTSPPRLPLIAPSILSADFANMGADCCGVLYGQPTAPEREVRTSSMFIRKKVLNPAYADLLHVDVMDGHFVPNLTMGPDMVKDLRRAMPEAFLDVHLMVTDPLLHAKAFAKAGADHITFHVEVVAADKMAQMVDAVRQLDAERGAVSVGLAINPPTPVEVILPHVELFDLILVMSVNPGFSGQAFIPDVLAKVERISEALSPSQRLEMDGGINPENVSACLDAGCDVVVAASAVFGKPASQRGQAIAALRGPSTPNAQ